jgi:hypothetical protein
LSPREGGVVAIDAKFLRLSRRRRRRRRSWRCNTE